ncbi:MAG TPA: glycosyltransferase family 8 protein [Candidatus Dormibacteraeota bacterium]|nr:glycosyltransferase family 8 protein [Candidatus Dormibacteraeota bacterium]
MTIEVACAAEGREYVAHSATMLHSLLAHHPRGTVRIHYMHGSDVSRRDERRLAMMVEHEGGSISFLRISDRELKGLPTKGFTRKATWYRVFLPELLPDVHKILYLDCDLIVCDSLAELFDTDMTNNWVGAVTNVFQHNHLHRPVELGLDGPEVYFNAGVLLMNLHEMRRDHCTEALLEYGRRNAAHLEWRDQDALNVVLGGRRLALHPRWNCMNSVLLFEAAEDVYGAEAVEEARDNAAIRHFEGPDTNKPWHHLCEAELRELYFDHRRATPWPRQRRPRFSIRRKRTAAV